MNDISSTTLEIIFNYIIMRSNRCGRQAEPEERGDKPANPQKDLLVVVSVAASFYLLSGAAEILPIGTAYAIWTGIGAAGTALFGMLVLNEPANAKRVACLAMVIAGSAGMKLFS